MPTKEPGSEVTEVARDWNAFTRNKAVDDACTRPQTQWIFRGQCSSAYGLTPSLLRALLLSANEPSADDVLKYEAAARDEFVTQAHVYLGAALFASAISEVHWWMHMQHFGAPTRLLDWTRSPFVAAYFACENPKTDGAVWALDVTLADFSMPCDLDEMTPENRDELRGTFLTPKAPDKLYLVNMGLRNERMTAQQGIFMLSNNPAVRHDRFLLNLALPKKRQRFRKILIPKDKKVAFCRRLQAMNINARSLFPGIDGLGRSISEMVRLRSFPDVD